MAKYAISEARTDLETNFAVNGREVNTKSNSSDTLNGNS